MQEGIFVDVFLMRAGVVGRVGKLESIMGMETGYDEFLQEAGGTEYYRLYRLVLERLERSCLAVYGECLRRTVLALPRAEDRLC